MSNGTACSGGNLACSQVPLKARRPEGAPEDVGVGRHVELLGQHVQRHRRAEAVVAAPAERGEGERPHGPSTAESRLWPIPLPRGGLGPKSASRFQKPLSRPEKAVQLGISAGLVGIPDLWEAQPILTSGKMVHRLDVSMSSTSRVAHPAALWLFPF